jgi:hypothetical protein
MLHEFVGVDGLAEAERATRACPELLQINALILNEVSKRMPESTIRVFASPYPNPEIWLMARRNVAGQ